MKFLVSLLVLFLAAPLAAQHQHSTMPLPPEPDVVDGLGDHHHPVSTKNREAQQHFDRGMTYVFAFNHDEAINSFRKAAQLDPTLAMAHWGEALALGPNINLDVDPEREKAAWEAVQRAKALAKDAPERERAYVDALSKRYSIDPKADLKKLAVDYKMAMGEMVKRYPDDLDLATLYAESAMDLRPWQLWTSDGKPAEGTEELIAVLESVLKRDPDHVGANHYYVHAVEASPKPERGIPSAERLKTLVPAAGHLVHMPGHIYMRVGDFEGAAVANEIAAEADRAYIERTGAAGVYPLMYYNHNLHFLSAARSMQGRFGDALKAANQLHQNVAPSVEAMPMIEGFLSMPLAILARFQKWDDVLKYPEPPASHPTEHGFWILARGLAFAGKSKPDSARKESDRLAKSIAALPESAYLGLNSAALVLEVGRHLLDGRMAMAGGDRSKAIASFRKAVTAQDALAYDEPPGFVYPVRETLGAALYADGKLEEAEKVFREDLDRNPRNGRSLFGLMKTLERMGKNESVPLIGAQFNEAWVKADLPLTMESL